MSQFTINILLIFIQHLQEAGGPNKFVSCIRFITNKHLNKLTLLT